MEATVSHPTTEIRGDSITKASLSHQAKVYTLTQAPYNQAKGSTLTQATLSHQAKVHTLTQAAAVQLSGSLLPRLQCPTQKSSQGGHSDPGYSVTP